MDNRKTEKASQEKGTAKAGEAKATVKETVAEAKESVMAAVKPAVKELEADAKAAVEAVEKETAKAVKAVKQKKTAKKEKEEVKPEVFVQYQGSEMQVADVVGRVKEAFVASGHRVSTIKTLQIYVKPEEAAAYYVINKKYDGKISLF